MPQQIRRRKQTTVEYSSNNKIDKSLSRGMIYRELHLRLTCQPTLTAGNNVYANILGGDEWAVVKRIQIIANGTDVIKSISGRTLKWLNFMWHAHTPRNSVALGAGGANPSCASSLILPFWMPRSIRPMDTALDSRQLSDLKIEITWGTYTDIAASASAWTTEPSMEVYSLECFGVNGPFATWRLFEIEKEITATNSQFQVQLPVGPVYRGFYMRTTDAAADANDILNNFKWKSGTTIFADQSAAVLFEDSMMSMSLHQDFSGTAYTDQMIGDANDLTGQYFYDHVTDGYLSEAIDTAGFSEHELELDVTVGAGTTKIVVVPSQIIPVRKQG